VAYISQVAITTFQDGGRIIRVLSDDGKVDVCGVWRNQFSGNGQYVEEEKALVKRLLLHWADPDSLDQITVGD